MLSAPAFLVGSSNIVTLTPPPSCALMALASASEMPMQGIVIDGSAPPMPGRPGDTLLPTITPVAPAACAARHLITNVHVPRSINAMLPFRKPPLMIGSQASSFGATPSSTRTTLPVKPPSVRAVPNVAVWFQRLALLFGRWTYDETGILDRTHLRFFTRSSLRSWLLSLGLRSIAWSSTPSFVASVARILRPLAKKRGDEMEEAFGAPFRFYLRWIEPIERAVCSLWPSLLAFQILVAAEPGKGGDHESRKLKAES